MKSQYLGFSTCLQMTVALGTKVLYGRLRSVPVALSVEDCVGGAVLIYQLVLRTANKIIYQLISTFIHNMINIH